jgi:anti-sigma regulatory factor (Ser/Thr protein kinase)
VNVSTEAAGERAWCVVVPHHARGARLARHRLTNALRGLVPSDLLADTVAVASELVGNAVRHAEPLPGGVIRIAWRLAPKGTPDCSLVEVRVTDGGADDSPVIRSVGPDAVNGRGLAIVAALAQTWGVERDGLGQCVWATLSTPKSA